MLVFLQSLPKELLNNNVLYNSHPVADLIKPYIKTYNVHLKWQEKTVIEHNLSFGQYMSITSQFIDLKSEIHQKRLNRIWNN